MSHRVRCTATTLLFLGSSALLHGVGAQQETGRLVGRVVFGTDSVAVEGATVSSPDVASAVTNPLGHFILDLPRGTHRLTVVLPARLADDPFEERFDITRGTTQRTWWIAPEVETAVDARGRVQRIGEDQARPIELAGVTVTATARRPERERKAVRSDYLDRQAIEALGPGIQNVGDLTRRMLGVRVVPSTGGTLCIQANRGRSQHSIISGDLSLATGLEGIEDDGCPDMVTVVVDGVVIQDAGHYVNSIRPEEIESVEYLGGITATQQYGWRGRYGALVIRTRIR